MSTNGSSVHHGFWINWSHGRIKGSTITLSERNGGLLTAFLALFVAITGSQLWKIISFAIHQTRASRNPRDGLHHQQQAVFRNAGSPSGVAWAFAQMPVYWWSAATRPLLRSLPWAVFALIYMAGFGLAGVFSSSVTKAAGNETLIVSSNCGRSVLDGDVQSYDSAGSAYLEKSLNDLSSAIDYARTCYMTSSSRSQLRCQIYTSSQIPFHREHNVSCPFAQGTCLVSDMAAFRMDTGHIDSHAVLGINTPPKDRVTYRRVTTCAPLRTKEFMSFHNVTGDNEPWGAAGDTLVMYNYGPQAQGNPSWRNLTYYYNKHSLVLNDDYTVSGAMAIASSKNSKLWRPLPQFNRTDADISLAFVAPNAIRFAAPSDDPFFPAHKVGSTIGASGRNQTYYMSDELVNVMGCTDQDQICGSFNGTCSPLSGVQQLADYLNLGQMGLSEVQRSIAERIVNETANARTYCAIAGPSSIALRAQEKVLGRLQPLLPKDQWTIEASWWFSIGLAKLQQQIVEYVTGPSIMYPYYHIERPNNEAGRYLCSNQKIRSTEKSISFSVLGMSIILVVGGMVIVLNHVLDTVIGFIQHRLLHRGEHRHRQWILNETLQLQRLAFEEAGMGTWSGTSSCIPVTQLGEQLVGFDSIELRKPLSAPTTSDTSAVGESEQQLSENAQLVACDSTELRKPLSAPTTSDTSAVGESEQQLSEDESQVEG